VGERVVEAGAAQQVGERHHHGEPDVDEPQVAGGVADPGVSRSPAGPGASAAIRLMAPLPTVGSTAITSTITPMPPIHWVIAR
jgi:hypothetical protein